MTTATIYTALSLDIAIGISNIPAERKEKEVIPKVPDALKEATHILRRELPILQ